MDSYGGKKERLRNAGPDTGGGRGVEAGVSGHELEHGDGAFIAGGLAAALRLEAGCGSCLGHMPLGRLSTGAGLPSALATVMCPQHRQAFSRKPAFCMEANRTEIGTLGTPFSKSFGVHEKIEASGNTFFSACALELRKGVPSVPISLPCRCVQRTGSFRDRSETPDLPGVPQTGIWNSSPLPLG